MKGPRLDQALVQRGLVATRSQAENYIKLGYVQVDDQTITKPGWPVPPQGRIALSLKQQYVSRAALKLDSVVDKLGLDFKGKSILDVGSSTGGFTDYALKHGAAKVIAVEVGADQMHPSLRQDKRVELHEHTDIRSLRLQNEEGRMQNTGKQNKKISPHSSFVILHSIPDIVLIDVSFISLREILPAVAGLVDGKAQIVPMAKPQFEAGEKDVHKGVVKNDAMRRQILKSFEEWAKKDFLIKEKADSAIAGAKGNLERFYLLRKKA